MATGTTTRVSRPRPLRPQTTIRRQRTLPRPPRSLRPPRRYESRQVWELGNGIPREEDGDEDGGATGRRRVAQLAAWSGGLSGAGTSRGFGTFGHHPAPKKFPG